MSKQDKWKFIYWVTFVIAFFAGKLSAYAKIEGKRQERRDIRNGV